MKSLLLKNKFQLAWAEYGAADGEPVFYFHGIPGSRLEACSADGIAKDLGIRLIAPDRPGYGGSEPQADFKLLDWPNAVSQLADKLNLNHFSILGFSGGGAYALACAHEIADHIKHITLVGGVAPFETKAMQNHINADFKLLYELAAADYPAAIQQVSQLAMSPEALLDVLLASLSPVDKALFKQAHIRQHYLQNITLAIHHGVNGIVNDMRNIKLPWQFNLEDTQLPVNIWHGRDDNNVGFAIAEHLAATLKNNSTHFLDNSGHCFLFAQWREILEHCKTQEPAQHEAAL